MTLKAAMGKVKITPDEITPLQGYDPETHIADPAKDVLDDLFARVLLLEQGSHRSVIVSVDCCLANEDTVLVADPGGRAGVYREFVPTFPPGTKKNWANAARTSAEAVTVCATHTHTAPAAFSLKYTARIEQLITELGDHLAPVKLSVAEGRSEISAFRRPALHADLSVPVNQKLMVLFVESIDGEPMGAVVNHAVHPTALRNPANRISGDMVGLAMTEVENSYSGVFTAMFIQGFSGDICPIYGDNGPTEDTYPDVVQGSRKLCFDILRAIEQKQEIAVNHIHSFSRTVSFATLANFYKPENEVTLFALSLGEALILAVSGEIFNDYMALVEKEIPVRYLFLAGVSNGYSGYLPTRKAFGDGLGGYEMNTTPYTDRLEEDFLKEIRAFFATLKG